MTKLLLCAVFFWREGKGFFFYLTEIFQTLSARSREMREVLQKKKNKQRVIT